MNKTQHTPGDWHLELGPGNGIAKPKILTESREKVIATIEFPNEVADTPEDFAEAYANARIIWAAPALLQACEAQHKALDILMAMLIQRDTDFKPTTCPAWTAVVAGNAAISKASGI